MSPNLKLNREQTEFIQQEVKLGNYRNAQEVIDTAILLLQEKQNRARKLQELIEVGGFGELQIQENQASGRPKTLDELRRIIDTDKPA